ncbi:MAG: regulator [Bdellovibrionaceae bacterium]|nr:regulator [Pseudobdellovibrionaceae bacterium]|tara:strand:+ start:8173 stop:9390 length:1218 start_codon:yes stop_codon:yes gene_type:complete
MKISLIIFVSFSLFSASSYPNEICNNGKAGDYPCKQINLEAELDLGKLGIHSNQGNDIWGWTDPLTLKEYAIMGLGNKTSFVDITHPKDPIYLGDLPSQTEASIWRDIKVYQNYAFIVSEASQHGMQIFDLTLLREVRSSPIQFENSAFYNRFGSAHNIVINEDTGFAYAVGTDTCDRGMHVVDIKNPLYPQFSTCIDRDIFEDTSSYQALHGEDYTHDAQCVLYHGPDTRYQGHEICMCANADTVNIVDVTDKSQPIQISVKKYSGIGYTHQGWLTEDHRFFILGDELDEKKFKHPTKTLLWNVEDLKNPIHHGTYVHSTKAIDHNLYIKGNLVFEANYDAGLRILDASDIENGQLKELGYFDTLPRRNRPTFDGAWSVYPYFKSGSIIVSNTDGRLFILRYEQ